MKYLAVILLLLASGCAGLHLRSPGEFKGKKSIEDPPIGREATPR